MRILIAEDDSMPRTLLSRLLDMWGFEVLVAEDGAQAWEHFMRSPPSMILSDWMMPHLTGVEFCRKVRAFPGRPYTYFILLTSRSDKESLVEALAAGADDFVSKPYDEQELHARIRSGERMLALSHELAQRLEQLTSANDFIGLIHKQMTADVDLLTADLRRWSEENERASAEQPEAEREVRRRAVTELQAVVDGWIQHTRRPLQETAGEIVALNTAVTPAESLTQAEPTAGPVTRTEPVTPVKPPDVDRKPPTQVI